MFNNETNAIFFALLSAFFAALTTIFGKIGVETINPSIETSGEGRIRIDRLSVNNLHYLPGGKTTGMARDVAQWMGMLGVQLLQRLYVLVKI